MDDTAQAWNKLHNEVINEFVPVKKVKPKKTGLPWMNGKLRKLLNKRLKTLQKYSKTKDKDDWTNYVRL